MNRAEKSNGDIVSIDCLIIGNQVKISPSDDNAQYVSKVTWFDDTLMAVSVPTNNGKFLKPVKGEELTFEFTKKDGFYVFESRFLRANVNTYVFHKPKNIYRIQKREFVRVTTLLQARVNHEHNSFIINISSNGALINVKNNICIGEEVFLEFELLNKPLCIKGKIVRFSSKGYGIEFTRIAKNDQDLIMRYVLKKMAGDRKKLGY